MAKAEASVEELVSMIERGELRLPEMQRRYVWRVTNCVHSLTAEIFARSAASANCGSFSGAKSELLEQANAQMHGAVDSEILTH